MRVWELWTSTPGFSPPLDAETWDPPTALPSVQKLEEWVTHFPPRRRTALGPWLDPGKTPRHLGMGVSDSLGAAPRSAFLRPSLPRDTLF